MHIRYNSSLKILGIPLLSIAAGPKAEAGETRSHARGILAVGEMATGLIAVGGVARGVSSLGGVAIGYADRLGGVSVGPATKAR
jgi:hypothetical protein